MKAARLVAEGWRLSSKLSFEFMHRLKNHMRSIHSNTGYTEQEKINLFNLFNHSIDFNRKIEQEPDSDSEDISILSQLASTSRALNL
jgi:hypothetical protein